MKMVKHLRKTENAQKLTFYLQHLLLALVALLASLISPCLSLSFLQTSTISPPLISLSRLSSSAQSFLYTTAFFSVPSWSCLSRQHQDQANAEISNEDKEHGLGYTLGGYRGFRGYFDKREAGLYKNQHVDNKPIYTADAEPVHTRDFNRLRILADFLSHLGKWVKLIKFEAKIEFFLHLEG